MQRGGPLKRKTELTRSGPIKAKPRPDKPRTPLRRTPIARAAPINRTGDGPQRPVKARKPLAPVSAARQVEKTARAALVAQLAAAGVGCEICPELARHGVTVPGGCSGLGGLHERRKRSASGALDSALNLVPACNLSNGWIETVGNDELRRIGVFAWLVVIEGAADWERCGPRRDPVPVEARYCERCGSAYLTVPPSGRAPCGHSASS